MSTQRQDLAFAFIRDTIECCGQSPSFEEIGAKIHVGKGRVHAIVKALIKQGLLVKTQAYVRNLALAGQPDLRAVTTGELWAELARRGETFDALAHPRPIKGASCAANLCNEKAQPGQLMCRKHWFSLPNNYRTAIMAAWSSRQLQAFGEAVEAARDFLGGYQRVVERVS